MSQVHTPIIFFDIETTARRYHLEIAIARQLLDEARIACENDDMMAELHAIRAIRRTAENRFKKAS